MKYDWNQALLTLHTLASHTANQPKEPYWSSPGKRSHGRWWCCPGSPRPWSENTDTKCQWVMANQRVHEQPAQLPDSPASWWSACWHLKSKERSMIKLPVYFKVLRSSNSYKVESFNCRPSCWHYTATECWTFNSEILQMCITQHCLDQTIKDSSDLFCTLHTIIQHFPRAVTCPGRS